MNVCKIGLKLTAQMLLYCQDVNELVRNAFFFCFYCQMIFQFLVFRLHLHSPPVACDARLGLYAFQSAGVRQGFCVFCLLDLPVTVCLPHLSFCFSFCLFVFISPPLYKPGGQFKHKHSTSIEIEKKEQ